MDVLRLESARMEVNTENIMITLDIDWAPDWVIDEVASILIEHKVKVTWFVTHATMAVERLRENSDLFELGLHPNCLPDSTHGKTEDEVLNHIKEIVPEAVSMRTHGLYQTTGFLKKAAERFGVKNDVSLLLPWMPHIRPLKFKWGNVSLNRIPYFWEDDFEFFEKNSSWSLSNPRYHGPGLKIFNFHPVLVFLNTSSYDSYRDLLARYPLNEWTPELINSYVKMGEGPRTLFRELVKLQRGGGAWIKEVVSKG